MKEEVWTTAQQLQKKCYVHNIKVFLSFFLWKLGGLLGLVWYQCFPSSIGSRLWTLQVRLTRVEPWLVVSGWMNNKLFLFKRGFTMNDIVTNYISQHTTKVKQQASQWHCDKLFPNTPQKSSNKLHELHVPTTTTQSFSSTILVNPFFVGWDFQQP